MKRKLSPRNRLFVREYLKDKNASRAYVAAGYSSKGARQSAHTLLTNPDIKLAIETGLARLEVKLEISAERVIKKLAEFAFPAKGQKLAARDIIKANELLGKHFKVFTEVIESTNTHSIQATLEQVNEAAKKFKGKL